MPGSAENLSEQISFALAEELLRKAGEMRVVTHGGSMLPAILPGDELVVRRVCLRNISIGDVVLFRQQGRWFVHRVRKLLPAGSQPCLITRGDALPSDDAPVFPEEMLGRIAFLVRDGEQRAISPWCSLSQTLLRAAVRHVPRFAGLYLRWHDFPFRFAPIPQTLLGPAPSKLTESVG